MVEVGLPASLEEKFVRQVLEVPVLGVKREESGVSLASEQDEAVGGAEVEDPATAATSQESSATTSTVDSASTAATSLSSTSNPGGESIRHLLRLRTALDFSLASYVQPSLRAALGPHLSHASNVPADFSPLDAHLAHVSKLKSDAQALRTISDNVSRKRGVLDDDEAIEKAEAKKRKKDEEEARKKNVSHGVKRLAKADTTGMKKLSSFFSAKPTAKKT